MGHRRVFESEGCRECGRVDIKNINRLLKDEDSKSNPLINPLLPEEYHLYKRTRCSSHETPMLDADAMLSRNRAASVYIVKPLCHVAY